MFLHTVEMQPVADVSELGTDVTHEVASHRSKRVHRGRSKHRQTFSKRDAVHVHTRQSTDQIDQSRIVHKVPNVRGKTFPIKLGHSQSMIQILESHSHIDLCGHAVLRDHVPISKAFPCQGFDNTHLDVEISFGISTDQERSRVLADMRIRTRSCCTEDMEKWYQHISPFTEACRIRSYKVHIDFVRPAVGRIRPDLWEPHVHTMDRVVHPGANTVYDILESGKCTGVQLCRSLLAVIGRVKQIAGI